MQIRKLVIHADGGWHKITLSGSPIIHVAVHGGLFYSNRMVEFWVYWDEEAAQYEREFRVFEDGEELIGDEIIRHRGSCVSDAGKAFHLHERFDLDKMYPQVGLNKDPFSLYADY